MGNNYFAFRQFSISQPEGVFRVGTDGVLLGAWAGLESPRVSTILDVGTGTGLIALMLAQRFPKASITAIEPEKKSFEAARENIANSPWSDRMVVYNLSFDEFASKCSRSYDLIVTNPPYFRDALKNPDQTIASYRHAEALPSVMIINHSKSLLSECGRLSVVLPWAEGNVFVAEAAPAGLYCSRMVKVRPLRGSPYNRLLLEFMAEKITPGMKILTLGHPAHGGYSHDYTDITKEFYL